MTPEYIAGLAGVVLSLAFSYIPKLKDWFDKQDSQYKQLFMLGAMFLVVAFVFGISCLGKSSVFACSGDGAWEALKVFAAAVIGNYVTYGTTKYIRK